jgi:hypothetical protein
MLRRDPPKAPDMPMQFEKRDYAGQCTDVARAPLLVPSLTRTDAAPTTTAAMRALHHSEAALLAANERLEDENKALRDRVRGTRARTASCVMQCAD